MSRRKQALEELLQGFLLKFGNSAENQKIIADEISQFMKSRRKISIKELDDLEEILLYKLSPSKKTYRKYSLSPIDSLSFNNKFNTSPTTLHLGSFPVTTKNNLRSHESRSKYYRRDNIIFPTDYIPEETSYEKAPKTLTPNKNNFKKKNDEWGKILKAESIKFEREMEISAVKQKIMKQVYSTELDKQLEQINQRKDFLKKQKEDEIHQISQKILDFEDYKQKVKNKRYEKTKEIERINLSHANRKKLEKIEEKKKNSDEDSLHLANAHKDLQENEERHRNIIKSKLSIAHDEERLLKLVPSKPKSLKEYEAEANLKERETLQKIIEEENQ
jgi:hypothetical protein